MLNICLAILSSLTVTVVNAAQYGHNYVAVQRDSDVVAKNFGNVTGIHLTSPVFTLNAIPDGFLDGTSGPTPDEDLDAFVKHLAKKNDWMHYAKADFTSEEGRPFPYIRLFTPMQPRHGRSTVEKIRVWLQGGVHGNEPAGDQSLLALLGELDSNQTWAASLLEKLDIMIFPRYNPDGVHYFQRALASNFDPNRDHVKLWRQQTRNIKSMFNAFSPHVAVDMHEYTASVEYGSYKRGSDGLFSAAKNLNIHPSIRNLSELLFANSIGEAMEARDLRWGPYAQGETDTSAVHGDEVVFAEAGSDARIGRNSMGLTQCVSFLIETRGIRLADQEFQRRTASALVMVSSVLQTAAINAETVLSTINDAIADFISSTDDVVVSDYSEITNRRFTMIDVRNGSVVQVPFKFRSSTPMVANLTRTRPESYLIPAGWSDVAQRLQGLGVEIQKLKEPWSGVVEASDITSISFGNKFSDGVVPATVTTEAVTKELELPAGSFMVSTRQKNAALAMVALEPENIDSYVSVNLIPVKKGDQYPIFRFYGN